MQSAAPAATTAAGSKLRPARPGVRVDRTHRPICVVAAVVMSELWALTAAVDAWSKGQTGVLTWILGFQFVSFVLALSVSMVSPGPEAQPIISRIRSRQPVTAD